MDPKPTNHGQGSSTRRYPCWSQGPASEPLVWAAGCLYYFHSGFFCCILLPASDRFVLSHSTGGRSLGCSFCSGPICSASSDLFKVYRISLYCFVRLLSNLACTAQAAVLSPAYSCHQAIYVDGSLMQPAKSGFQAPGRLRVAH